MSATACDSCGEPITWALTEAGKAIPLVNHPVEAGHGNLAVVREASGQLRARTITAKRPLEEHEHVGRSHFADCPSAQKHRRPRV